MPASSALALGVAVAAAYLVPVAGPAPAVLEPVSQGVFLARQDGDVQVLQHTLVAAGDAVRTDALGNAVLRYYDGTTFVLEPGVELSITQVQRDDLFALIRRTAERLWGELIHGTSAYARYDSSAGALAAVVRAGSRVEVRVGPDGSTSVVATSGSVDPTTPRAAPLGRGGTGLPTTLAKPSPNAPADAAPGAKPAPVALPQPAAREGDGSVVAPVVVAAPAPVLSPVVGSGGSSGSSSKGGDAKTPSSTPGKDTISGSGSTATNAQGSGEATAKTKDGGKSASRDGAKSDGPDRNKGKGNR